MPSSAAWVGKVTTDIEDSDGPEPCAYSPPLVVSLLLVALERSRNGYDPLPPDTGSRCPGGHQRPIPFAYALSGWCRAQWRLALCGNAA